MAVVGYGFTRTVTGELSVEECMKTLPQVDKTLVSERKDNVIFISGDEEEVLYTTSAKFPIVMGAQELFLTPVLLKVDFRVCLPTLSCFRTAQLYYGFLVVYRAVDLSL